MVVHFGIVLRLQNNRFDTKVTALTRMLEKTFSVW